MLLRQSLSPLAFALALVACAGASADDPDLYRSLTDADVGLAAGLLQTTLESVPDGATRSWRNAANGHRGSITPTRTYLSAAGHVCRDYREELELDAQSGRFYHAACREADASWVWL